VLDAKGCFLCVEKQANESPDQLNVIHPFSGYNQFFSEIAVLHFHIHN
jgi:hypothetical protein